MAKTPEQYNLNKGADSAQSRDAGTKATQAVEFSQHPGHGSAKRTMASHNPSLFGK